MIKTRSVSIDERLYRAIKARAKKNHTSIKNQASYWIQLGMYLDQHLSEPVCRQLIGGEIELSVLQALLRAKKKDLYLAFLINELAKFSVRPTRVGAKLCRGIISSLRSRKHEDKRVLIFLDRADQTVARPYMGAHHEITELINWYNAINAPKMEN